MSSKAYDQHRKRLEALLAHLTRRTEAAERDLRHGDRPLEKDFEEQVTQVENDEVLAALAKEGPHLIEMVTSSLARMDSGDYGTCEDCGTTIAAARLDALPYAATCIRCAERRESERA